MEYSTEKFAEFLICKLTVLNADIEADHGGIFQYLRVGDTMYGFVIFLIKLAILLQYLRIFVPLKTHNAFFWTCHGLIWLNCMYYLVCAFLNIFACLPINKFWKPWIEGHCLDFRAVNVSAAVINTASDFSILILPQHAIWSLQMSLRKKIGISILFLTGVL